jgi:transcriptional regulator with XRE-family HTH domain|tara:strand:- start:2401 stop:3186 length:786 start_codon:yes stop_codon:yes gene_type:complete
MNSEWESQLKRMRSSRGLTLEQCSNITKIPISFLIALENRDFSSLPAKIYSEFHIKKYFSFLGINPSECLQEYKSSISELNFDEKDEDKKQEKNEYLSFLIKFPYLVPGIFILSVFSLILIINFQKTENFYDEKEFSKAIEIETKKEEVAIESQKEKYSSENPLILNLEEIDNVLEKPLKKVPDRIKIIVSEESWIIIEEENDKNLIYELMQNEEREVLGYKPLIFKIGNPEATKIFINNKIINISRISKKDANYSYFEIK